MANPYSRVIAEDRATDGNDHSLAIVPDTSVYVIRDVVIARVSGSVNSDTALFNWPHATQFPIILSTFFSAPSTIHWTGYQVLEREGWLFWTAPSGEATIRVSGYVLDYVR